MERLSHYQIVRPLGRGGMGEVFEALDLDLGRHVALKFVTTSNADDPDALRRFEREARAAAALHHAHIATLFAFDRSVERPFIAMELLAGPTLREVIARGPMPVSEALAVTREVAGALAFAHRRGVAHRDIKPQNLMFDGEGAIKITDFGLAHVADTTRLTTTGAAFGTAAYMAPESLRGAAAADGAATDALPPAAPADVFALGVTLHEMLTGEMPFPGDSALAVMYAITHDEPRGLRASHPDIPQEVEQLVARMLTKLPAERPSAEEVARQLARLTGVSMTVSGRASSGVPPDPDAPTQAIDTSAVREVALANGGTSTPRFRPRALQVVGVLFVATALVGVALLIAWRRGLGQGVPSREAVALNNAGLDSLNAGSITVARDRFESALRLSPRYDEARLNLATVLHRQGSDDGAAALYGAVLAETPKGRSELIAAADYGLGEIDLHAGAWSSAIAHLAAASRRDSSRAEYSNNLGYALIRAGRNDEALATLRAARARFPGEAALLKNSSLAWLQAGRFDSAAITAREAVRLQPVFPQAWSLRARSEAALGDLAAARASLEALRQQHPEPDVLEEAEIAVRTASVSRAPTSRGRR